MPYPIILEYDVGENHSATGFVTTPMPDRAGELAVPTGTGLASLNRDGRISPSKVERSGCGAPFGRR